MWSWGNNQVETDTVYKSLTAYLNSIKEKEHSERKEYLKDRTEKYVYPSEAGSCLRKVAFRVLDNGETYRYKDGKALLNFLLGDTVHQAIQNSLLKKFPDFIAEVSFKWGKYSGRVDGIFTYQGKRTILEIKTAGYSTWKFVKKQDSPTEENILQASIGARALGATHILIVYVSKAPSNDETGVLEFLVPVNNKGVDIETARLNEVLDMLEEGFLPAREYKGNIILNPYDKAIKFPCPYCDYIGTCISYPSGLTPL